MARLRQDPTTWQWVITGNAIPAPSTGAAEPCPFCPSQQTAGHEIIIAERRDAQSNWLVRVVADRAPLLRIEGELDRSGEGIFDTMNAIGAHEIIIEGQKHDATVGSLEPELFRLLVEVFRERLLDLKHDPRLRYIEIFQNQGPLAGALVSHPHAQLVASPVLPHRVERELRACQRHYQNKERCLFCDLLRQEIKDQKGIVADQDGFVLLCPYASRYPYEMWLLPRRHHSCFEESVASPDVLAALANSLQSALRKAERLSSSLHFVLHTEPSRLLPPVLQARWKTLSEDFHWHFEILPRLEARRKYLREEEFYLNPVLPEAAAQQLRRL